MAMVVCLLFGRQVVPDSCDSMECSQAPLSMGCPRQEHWSELPVSISGDLLDPGIKSESPALAGGLSQWGNMIEK